MNLKEFDKIQIIEFLKERQAKRIFVVTPINILRHMGFAVSDHKFILENKPTIKKLQQILAELEKDQILTKREPKQDFLGIREVGYDYNSY